MRIDFQAVRERVPLVDFLEARGVELRNAGGGRLVALCPLHEERTSSFYTFPDGHCHCFGCGFHGDVVDLAAALTGQQLAEAARNLGAGEIPEVSQTSKPKPKIDPPYTLSASERRRMAAAATRLAQAPLKIAKMVRDRPEWNTDAVRGAALDGVLGFELDCRHWTTERDFSGPALLFGYNHGIKARWPNGPDGKKNTRWLCGGPGGECWRQNLLLSAHLRIVFCEGETDALTLVSAGIESAGATLVVGLASATVFPNPKPFTGREVVIVPDPDESGRKSAVKLRALLRPLARRIVTIEIEEIYG
jgi:DNA primase